MLRYEKGVDDDIQGAANWGGGLRYEIAERLAFRWELRHVHTFEDSHDNATLTGLFTYEFAP